ncbi:MAG TPA: hypothetical protein VGZ00_09060 [Candidatus Baltobacteraceae bacterium]|nr:hypothetical protein [Candidatus Baltobacteraceae bacterium]
MRDAAFGAAFFAALRRLVAFLRVAALRTGAFTRFVAVRTLFLRREAFRAGAFAVRFLVFVPAAFLTAIVGNRSFLRNVGL